MRCAGRRSGQGSFQALCRTHERACQKHPALRDAELLSAFCATSRARPHGISEGASGEAGGRSFRFAHRVFRLGEQWQLALDFFGQMQRDRISPAPSPHSSATLSNGKQAFLFDAHARACLAIWAEQIVAVGGLPGYNAHLFRTMKTTTWIQERVACNSTRHCMHTPDVSASLMLHQVRLFAKGRQACTCRIRKIKVSPSALSLNTRPAHAVESSGPPGLQPFKVSMKEGRRFISPSIVCTARFFCPIFCLSCRVRQTYSVPSYLQQFGAQFPYPRARGWRKGFRCLQVPSSLMHARCSQRYSLLFNRNAHSL